MSSSVTHLRSNPNGKREIPPPKDEVYFAQKQLTAAQFLALSVTAIEIVPAPGAGLILALHDCLLYMDYGTAATANGGVVLLQYGNTAAGLGEAASATLAAATVNGATADTLWRLTPDNAVPGATSVNLGLFLSNATAPFITGDSTFRVRVAYRIITSSNA